MKGVSGWPLHYIGFGFLVSQGNSGHLITKKETKLKINGSGSLAAKDRDRPEVKKSFQYL